MAAGIVFVAAGVNDFLPARPPKHAPGLIFHLLLSGLAVAGGLGYNLKKNRAAHGQEVIQVTMRSAHHDRAR